MSPDVITLAIPARTEYLILARLALAGIGHEVPIEQATLADLKLAVTEACGNAVRHGCQLSWKWFTVPRETPSERDATRCAER